MASPEDMFDGEDESLGELEQDFTGRRRLLAMNDPLVRVARRELRWFYETMHGRVPVVGSVSSEAVAAASRIAGWLSELEPSHRGAFVVRYDGRPWPVRIIRQFGGLTSVAVRLAAARRPRGPNETLAEAEQAAVAQLLEHIAVARRPPGPRGGPSPHGVSMELRRLQRAAQSDVRRAERAYLEARGHAPCVVPPPSREGA